MPVMPWLGASTYPIITMIYPAKGPGLIFALYVEGDIARDLCKLCWKSWYNFSSVFRTMPCKPPAGLPKTVSGQSCLVRMRRNDWVRRKTKYPTATWRCSVMPGHISRSVAAISCPGKSFGACLQRLPKGRKDPYHHCRPIRCYGGKNAERWMYDWLLRNNIELYEYQASVLHAKVAVCDGEWATVGSYNINKISAYASIELNLDVRGANFQRSWRINYRLSLPVIV